MFYKQSSQKLKLKKKVVNVYMGVLRFWRRFIRWFKTCDIIRKNIIYHVNGGRDTKRRKMYSSVTTYIRTIIMSHINIIAGTQSISLTILPLTI